MFKSLRPVHVVTLVAALALLVGCGSSEGDGVSSRSSDASKTSQIGDLDRLDICAWANGALADAGNLIMTMDEGVYVIREATERGEYTISDDNAEASCTLLRDDDTSSSAQAVDVVLKRQPTRNFAEDQAHDPENGTYRLEHHGIVGIFYYDTLEIQLDSDHFLELELFAGSGSFDSHDAVNFDTLLAPLARELVDSWLAGEVPTTSGDTEDGPLVTNDALEVCGALDLTAIPGLLGVPEAQTELDVQSDPTYVSCEVGEKGIPNRVDIYMKWTGSDEGARAELENYPVEGACMVDGDYVFWECPDEVLFWEVYTVSGPVYIEVAGYYDGVTSDQVLEIAKGVVESVRSITYG